MKGQAMTDTRQVLEEAWEAVFGMKSITAMLALRGASNELSKKANRFRRFLDAEAWTDAALCLVPLNCQCVVTIFDGGEGEVILTDNDGRDIERTAAIPALAIAQAALRAKEAGDV